MSRRIARLVSMKQRCADAADAEVAAARRATEAAESARALARAASEDAAKRATAVTTSTDLAVNDAWIRTLEKAVMRANAAVAIAKQHEARAQARATSAHVELRKFETWEENTLAAVAMEAKRVARVAEDELAARKRRGEP